MQYDKILKNIKDYQIGVMPSMRTWYEPGRKPTIETLAPGDLEYNINDNALYTRGTQNEIIEISLGGVGGLEIKGTDTIANILILTGNMGDIWIANNDDAGATPPGVTGDGYSWNTDLNSWVNIGPIRGPQGDPGLIGPEGPTGSDGSDGINGLPGDGPTNRNKIINGDFSVWQRDHDFSGFTINAGDWKFTSDRWLVAMLNATSGSVWVYKQDLGNEHTGCYGLTVDPQSLVLGSSPFVILQRIENVCTLAGKEITMSVELENHGASYDHDFMFNQHFGVSGSADVNTTTTVTVPTGRSIIQTTVTLPNIIGKTIGVGNYLQVYILRTFSTPKVTFISAQIEDGAATGFEKKGPGRELFDCQRYYYKAVGQGIEGLNPDCHAALTYSQVIKWPNMMRTNPTTSSNFDDAVNNINGGHSCGVINSAAVGESSKYVWNLQILTSGATTGCWFGMGTTDFVEASAEL